MRYLSMFGDVLIGVSVVLLIASGCMCIEKKMSERDTSCQIDGNHTPTPIIKVYSTKGDK